MKLLERFFPQNKRIGRTPTTMVIEGDQPSEMEIEIPLPISIFEPHTKTWLTKTYFGVWQLENYDYFGEAEPITDPEEIRYYDSLARIQARKK